MDEVQFEAVQQYKIGRTWYTAGVAVFTDEESACEYSHRLAGRLHDWERVIVQRLTRDHISVYDGRG